MTTIVWAILAAALLTTVTVGAVILFATSPKALRRFVRSLELLELLDLLQFLG
jgi:hypothetical protein